MGPKWNAYLQAANTRKVAEEWLKHIGKTGRTSAHGHTDILRLSPAHASVKLCIAGQYDTGGQNYRESPDEFNIVLREIIHDKFRELRAEVERRLREREASALIQARDEVTATLTAIDKAASEIDAASLAEVSL